MKREYAESVAAQALGWIAATEDLLDTFMGATGTDAADIRSRAESPAFLGSVLDFLLLDDAWVTGFCDATGHRYDIPGIARQVLPGGQQVHWT